MFYFGNWRPPKPEPEGEPVPEMPLPEDPDPGGVNAWRLERLLAAGWDDLHAALLACDHTVDLHRACELLEAGCPPQRAWEILA